MKTQVNYTKIVEAIVKPLSIEGTSASPRKYSITEARKRCDNVLINLIDGSINYGLSKEQYEEVVEGVIEGLRSLNRIKKEQSNYNEAQTIISYRVLSPKNLNALVPSLYKSGTWSIELEKESLKRFRSCVNEPTKENGIWTISKGLDKGTNEPSSKICSFSPNYGEIKIK